MNVKGQRRMTKKNYVGLNEIWLLFLRSLRYKILSTKMWKLVCMMGNIMKAAVIMNVFKLLKLHNEHGLILIEIWKMVSLIIECLYNAEMRYRFDCK